jgi:hypothetical protein
LCVRQRPVHSWNYRKELAYRGSPARGRIDENEPKICQGRPALAV